MNRLRSRPIPQVDPSARDPIASWLDVFIALLALPRAQRQTIRDELEDHLRSRVDDLLITGLSEPEAVRAAVGELGETAHLARAFRAAARPTHTRRLLMTAAACTTIGAALAIGIATLTGAPGSAAGHPESPALAAASDTPLIPLRGVTFGQLFETIAQHTPKPVLIHWDRLEQLGITPDAEVGLDVDPLPPHIVHTLIKERAEDLAREPIAVHESDDLVEISTQSHFDLRTTELRHYDVRDLVCPQNSLPATFDNGDQLVHVMQDLCDSSVWIDNGGDLARARTVGPTLFVDAPARIHVLVGTVLGTLRDQQRQALDRAGRDAAEAGAERLAYASALRAALDEVSGEYAHLRARCDRLMIDHANAQSANDLDKADSLLTELTLLEVQRNLAEARVASLTGRIVTVDSDTRVPQAGAHLSLQPALRPASDPLGGAR